MKLDMGEEQILIQRLGRTEKQCRYEQYNKYLYTDNR